MKNILIFVGGVAAGILTSIGVCLLGQEEPRSMIDNDHEDALGDEVDTEDIAGEIDDHVEDVVFEDDEDDINGGEDRRSILFRDYLNLS